MINISYKDAGVDIDAGNNFVKNIKDDIKSTFDKNVIGGIGSFAGAYKLPSGYKEPIILSATDGVGTKLLLAIKSQRFDTIGIDLVAMCVNDLICNFGTPLFFLDYYATGKLINNDAQKIIKGIIKGCKIAECSLIGGETAEMPNMYKENDFDLAGFAVGIADKLEMDRISRIKAGQSIIALPSNGIHSNGYSLVRKLFFDKLGMNLKDNFNNKPLIDTLLTPTKIYVKEFKENRDKIVALAHITGGGIVENLYRILPSDLKAIIKKDKIKILPIFEFMSQYIDEDEMYRTFNMGVGMTLIVEDKYVDEICKNTGGYLIGHIEEGKRGVDLI
jgi:phosphoribosylformylglycinamidine cyclo-ligase